MNVAVTPATARLRQTSILRVMVVDDAASVRALIAGWVNADPGMEVVAALRTGRAAVEQVGRVRPDVIILDVDMPELDGISALPQLFARKRDVVVIMASAFTRRHAELSIRALMLGAADYVPKPQARNGVSAVAQFRAELIGKVRELGRRRRPVAAPSIVPKLEPDRAAIALRPFPRRVPQALLIGASTGGPQALLKLLAGLGPVIDRVPVLIVQHMPPLFTAVLADHLSHEIRRPVREAEDGEAVRAGTVYLGPGGRHMRVVRRGTSAAISIGDDPPINYCRPAVDPLLFSAAAVWGGRSAAVLLTGMGSDGAQGAAAVAGAGGCVLAQDEASSVVWGMPGAAAQAGVCSAILPPARLATCLVRLFAGTPP